MIIKRFILPSDQFDPVALSSPLQGQHCPEAHGHHPEQNRISQLKNTAFRLTWLTGYRILTSC